jgi:nitroreductase
MIEAIKKRRSVRSYLNKIVEDEIINEVLKAGFFAPQSKNNKSLRFIIVKSSEQKSYLYKMLGQAYLKQAPLLVIPVIDGEISTTPEADVAVASQNIFLQAADFGLGTVWKKVSPRFRAKVKKYFGLPERYLLYNIIPIGYPKNLKRPHDERDFSKSWIIPDRWKE